MTTTEHSLLTTKLMELESEITKQNRTWIEENEELTEYYRSCFGVLSQHIALRNKKEWTERALTIIVQNEIDLTPTSTSLKLKLTNLRNFGERAGMSAEQLTKCAHLTEKVAQTSETLRGTIYCWKEKLAPPNGVWEQIFSGFSLDALCQRLGMEEKGSLPDGGTSLRFEEEMC